MESFIFCKNGPSFLNGGIRTPTIIEAALFFDSLERTVLFMKEKGLIMNEHKCPLCNQAMSFPTRFEDPGKLFWRCRKVRGDGKQCTKKRSIFYNTFFFDMRLDVRRVMLLMVFFMWNMTISFATDTLFENKSDRKTVGRWYRYFREITAVSLIRNPVKVGGQGYIVEADEMVIQRRKYRRGRLKSGEQWLFGVVQRPLHDHDLPK